MRVYNGKYKYNIRYSSFAVCGRVGSIGTQRTMGTLSSEHAFSIYLVYFFSSHWGKAMPRLSHNADHDHQLVNAYRLAVAFIFIPINMYFSTFSLFCIFRPWSYFVFGFSWSQQRGRQHERLIFVIPFTVALEEERQRGRAGRRKGEGCRFLIPFTCTFAFEKCWKWNIHDFKCFCKRPRCWYNEFVEIARKIIICSIWCSVMMAKRKKNVYDGNWREVGNSSDNESQVE